MDVSSRFGKDVAHALNDVARMLCIQVTAQLLLFFGDASPAFFSTDFVLLSLYITLGVLVYWLVLRQLLEWR